MQGAGGRFARSVAAMISDVPGYRRGLRAGFVAGLVAAGVLAMCMAPPAHAAPFATVTASDGATVTLRTDRGPCLGDALLAVWQSADGQRQVPGCWVLADGGTVVLVSWLDGDRGNLPVSRLVKARAS